MFGCYGEGCTVGCILDPVITERVFVSVSQPTEVQLIWFISLHIRSM